MALGMFITSMVLGAYAPRHSAACWNLLTRRRTPSAYMPLSTPTRKPKFTQQRKSDGDQQLQAADLDAGWARIRNEGLPGTDPEPLWGKDKGSRIKSLIKVWEARVQYCF
jgi:hypothetical protein